ncbi:Myosin 10A, isoform D [Phlyctochytrium bullatum]|nr:Myosin 10A, isoform D [Phlyctochytrium bullatum]
MLDKSPLPDAVVVQAAAGVVTNGDRRSHRHQKDPSGRSAAAVADTTGKKHKPWKGLFKSSKSKRDHLKEPSQDTPPTVVDPHKTPETSATYLPDPAATAEAQPDDPSAQQGQLRSWYKRYKSTTTDTGDITSPKPHSQHPGSTSTRDVSTHAPPAPPSRTPSFDAGSETGSQSCASLSTVSARNNGARPVVVAAAPGKHHAAGGVLAHGKWFHLSEADVDFEEAGRKGVGAVQRTPEGGVRFVLDLERIGKVEIQRQEVIFELIMTEKEYIRDLQLIINLFLSRMRTNAILPAKHLALVFSNIEQILPVNQELLRLLEQRRRTSLGVLEQVGDIFLSVAQFLKMYTIYCGNQPEAMAFLKAQSGNAELTLFLQYCKLRPDCRGFDLGAFLLKPVQRICKYPLLMKQILKYTPEDHKDYANLKEAFSLINSVVETVNERRRFVENQQKMLECIARLDFDFKLEPSRRFVMEGNLQRYNPHSLMSKTQQRWIVLFNDYLVLAKPAGLYGGKQQVTRVIHATNLHAADLPSNPRYPFSFKLTVCGGDKSYFFMAESNTLKQQWIGMVNETARNATEAWMEMKHGERRSSLGVHGVGVGVGVGVDNMRDSIKLLTSSLSGSPLAAVACGHEFGGEGLSSLSLQDKRRFSSIPDFASPRPPPLFRAHSYPAIRAAAARGAPKLDASIPPQSVVMSAETLYGSTRDLSRIS